MFLKPLVPAFSLVLIGACTGKLTETNAVTDPCRMAPRWPQMELPGQGVLSLDAESLCGEIPVEGWQRQSGRSYDLLVHAYGPGGSGRYWTVNVSVAEKGTAVPTRALCFETSTIGWRTLQNFEDKPIPWMEDLNADGDPELLVWDSFIADGDPEFGNYTYGLVAWAYRVDRSGKFTLDLPLSRKFAARILAAYRKGESGPDKPSARSVAAGQVEAFVQGKCKIADDKR